MVKIRLKRLGTTKRPFYRIVVADSRSPRSGKFIEEIGTYDPLTSPAKVAVDADKVHAWMKKGAQPTDSARSLFAQLGILEKVQRRTVPPKVKEAPQEKPKAEESVVETVEEATEAVDEEPEAAEDVAVGVGSDESKE